MPRSNINQTNIGRGFSLSPISAVEASRLPRNSLFLDKDNQLSFKSMTGVITTALNAAGQVPIPIGINVWNAVNNQVTLAPRNIIKFTGTAIASITDNAGSGLVQVEINSPTGVEFVANKNQPGGYAGLNGSGKVDAAQLPSYVDDVEEYADLASFPVTGETGKLYVALDTDLIYRWSGSVYTLVGGDPSLFQPKSEKDQVNGYAGLDGAGKLALGQIPDLGLGTAASYDVAVSGNAGAGEVVKGDDTRLSDARTPTSHALSDHSDYPVGGLVSFGADGETIEVASGTSTGIFTSTGFPVMQLNQSFTSLGYLAGLAVNTYTSPFYPTNSTAIGYQSLQGAAPGSTTAVGALALGAITDPNAAGNTAVGTLSGGGVTTGSNNVMLGKEAGKAITTSSNHVAIGVQSYYGAGSGSVTGTGGNGGVAVGYQALYSATGNSSAVAMGYRAGYSNASVSSNVYVGYQAGMGNISGTSNVYMGPDAGANQATGDYNVGVGLNACRGTTGSLSNTVSLGANANYISLGSNHIGVGHHAGYAVGNCTGTVSLGAYALYGSGSSGVSTANGTIAIGMEALYSVSAGVHNTTAVGYQAGKAVITATNNTFLGYQSGTLVNSGSNNTFQGAFAGASTTTGSHNIFMGYYAGYNVGTGVQNTIIGSTTQSTNGSTENTFVGYLSGGTMSANSVAVGSRAGTVAVGGSENTYIGAYCAGNASTTNISGNTVSGYKAGYSLQVSQATLYGRESGYTVTTGSRPTAFGYRAGYSNLAGADTTYIGYEAGYSALGGGNTAVGARAGRNVTTGAENTFLGLWSGYTYPTTTGSNNTYIGTYAGEAASAAVTAAGDTPGAITNAIAIGRNAFVVRSNMAQVGDASVSRMKIGGALDMNMADGFIIPLVPTNLGDYDGVTEYRFSEIYTDTINLVDRTTDPATPAVGSVLYIKNGVLTTRDSSGTIRTYSFT